MAARAAWKGLLQISVVQIPVKLFAATEASDPIGLHQLHAACQTRISQPRTCVACQRPVPPEEIVKAFEVAPGQYVPLLPEELDAIAPVSSRVLEVLHFAPAEQLELRHIDRTYLLEADGAHDEDYRTVQAAMHGRVGLGTLALYGREYLAAIGLQGGVLLLYTLHHAAELRALPAAPPTSDAYLPGVRDARQLFIAMTQPLDLTAFQNQQQRDLRQLIDAKIAGEEYIVPAAVERGPRGYFKAALEQSLATVSAGKKTTAKALPPAKRKRAS